MISRPRRSTQVISILLVVGLFGMAAGAGAVGVNAFGAGDKFDRLLAKIDRLIRITQRRAMSDHVQVRESRHAVDNFFGNAFGQSLDVGIRTRTR